MFGRYRFLLVLAALFLLSGLALETMAGRSRYLLSDEEYARRAARNPHTSRTALSPAGEKAYRAAGTLFFGGLALLFGWWLLN